ncbi:MAG TPA: trypsin-like peptidase domain-containing protein [Stellaceae bacterium]|nr:trypsin-like peptidase domain-containing protein [Stellaceae bacterium]
MERRRTLRYVAVAVAFALGAGPAAAADGPAGPYFDGARGVYTFARVLDRVLPSVVQITIFSIDGGKGGGIAELTRKSGSGNRGSGSGEAKERRIGSGSGVVIDAVKGYVLTNNHVVTAEDKVPADQLRLKVGLRDGREFPAEVVGRDDLTDIALVRIPPEKLTAIDIADSGSLQVGDIVMAIGYPLGLDQTVTFGVVSGLRRHLSDKQLQDFIQTDAAINHGNSGGPLIDSHGRLVGISTAIANPYGEGSIGLNFAVPTRIAIEVTSQLERYGSVHRAPIGITAGDLTPGLAKAMGSPVPLGALIREVEPETAAAKAGLRPGDIVFRAAETEISSAADLRNIIGLTETGQAISISFYRDGREMAVTVTIPPQPVVSTVSPPASGGLRQVPDPTETILFGATFRDLSADHPLHGKIQGVTVASVAGGSPAEGQDLRPGDVVTAVNKHPTPSLVAFKQAVAGATDAIAMKVIRGNSVRIAVFARTKEGAG